MFTFIYGSAGSGKSTCIRSLLTDAANQILQTTTTENRRLWLLVPEQQAVISEAETAKELPPAAQLFFECVNFKRLANRVFRTCGGLSYSHLTNAGRALLMWRAVVSVLPYLRFYKEAARSDAAMIPQLLALASEFSACGITPQTLLQIQESDETDSLAKFSDIAMIYAAYSRLLCEYFEDDNGGDVLRELADTLKISDFFRGSDVYIDSFHGFTAVEFEILRYILRKADNVTISLCLPASEHHEGDPLSHLRRDIKHAPPCFAVQAETAKMLLKLAADSHAEIRVIPLTENRRANGVLAYVEKHLYDYAAPVYEEDPSAVKILPCADKFEEADCAAREILSRIMADPTLKYSDCAVIVRDVESWRGIADAVFEKYGIPVYMSARTDLTTKPAVRLILHAVAAAAKNYRAEDVIALAKTGFCGISPALCDELESYVDTWRISGKRFTEPWAMNPAGYAASMSAENAADLAAVNEARQILLDPLEALSAVITDSESDAERKCAAIFDYLAHLDVAAQTEARAVQLENENRFAEAAEERQLMAAITDAVSTVSDRMRGLCLTAAELYTLLRYVFQNTDIGSIPTGIDVVSIGGASLLRLAHVRHAIVLGADAGEFPRAGGSSDSLLSESDRIRLEGMGIHLSPDAAYRNEQELFWFYRAVTVPSESLTVLYEKTPSMPVSRMMKLCGIDPKNRGAGVHFENAALARHPEADLLYRPLQTAERFRSLEDESVMAAAKIALAEEGIAVNDAPGDPFTGDEESLPENLTSALFGKRISLTKSRLESFALCRLSYYLKYHLKLQEERPASFSAAHTGNFIHRILEEFMRRAVKEQEGGIAALDEKETERITDEIISDYAASVCHGLPPRGKGRTLALFARLRRAVLLFIKSLKEEFTESDFVPAYFELPITAGAEECPPPLSFKLPDGTAISIYGIADRVDVLHRGNDTYVRIADYKTGYQDFSLSDIEFGINLQLLLYLFAIVKCPDGVFKKELTGGKSGEILPAGISYFTARTPSVSVNAEAEDNDVAAALTKGLVRKGLYLENEGVLRAMDPELAGKFIPVKLKKDGGFAKTASLASLAEFGQLYREIGEVVCGIGDAMKSGDASADPLNRANIGACEFCPLAAVCRKRG